MPCADIRTPATWPPARAEAPSAERAPEAPTEGRVFTLSLVALCDGSDPRRPVLIAYPGRVYDVSESFLWMHGRHFWLRANQDLTDRLKEPPHGEEMLARVPWPYVACSRPLASASTPMIMMPVTR